MNRCQGGAVFQVEQRRADWRSLGALVKAPAFGMTPEGAAVEDFRLSHYQESSSFDGLIFVLLD